MAADPLRLGILGAAHIAPMALVRPAQRVPEATVLAVAARDPERARRFAARHGIPRVHPSYDALLADAVRAVEADYPAAARAARRLAEEVFSAAAVLPGLLAAAGA